MRSAMLVLLLLPTTAHGAWGGLAAPLRGAQCNAFQADAADLDGDGRDEFAVACIDQPNLVVGLRDGALVTLWESPESDSTQGVSWGDVDGDGDPDLAVGNFGGPTRLYGNDAGVLRLRWSSVEQAESKDVEWVDLDGDGALDLVVAGVDGDSWHRNVGGALQAARPLDLGGSTDDVAFADIDGDGDADAAAATSGTPEAVDLVLRNGGGELTVAWTTPAREQGSAVAWGDVDGDGCLDLAVARPDGRDAIWRCAGDGYELLWRADEALHSREVAIADVDGDGDLDVLWGVEAPLTVLVFDGGEVAGTWVDGEESELVEALAVGDADGDGRVDVLIGARDADRDWTRGQRGGPRLRLYLGTGRAPTAGASQRGDPRDGPRGRSDSALPDRARGPDAGRPAPLPSRGPGSPVAGWLALLLALCAGLLAAWRRLDFEARCAGLALLFAASLLGARCTLQPVQPYGGASSELIEHAQRVELTLAERVSPSPSLAAAVRRWDDQVISHPAGLHALGRLGALGGDRVGAVLWMGLAWLALLAAGVGAVGRSLSGRAAAGWASAAVTLLLPGAVGAAARFHYDLPMTALLWAAAGVLVGTGRWRLRAVLGGLLLGLAAAVKWTALPFGAVLLGALLLHRTSKRGRATLAVGAGVGLLCVAAYVSAAPTSFGAASLAAGSDAPGGSPVSTVLRAALAGLTQQTPGRLAWYPLALIGGVFSPVLVVALALGWRAWPRSAWTLGLVIAGQLAFLLLAIAPLDERFVLTLAPALLLGAVLGAWRRPRPRRWLLGILAVSALVGLDFHLGPKAPWNAELPVLSAGPRHPALSLRGVMLQGSFERRGWSRRDATPDPPDAAREELWRLLERCGIHQIGLADGLGETGDTYWFRYRAALARLEGGALPTPLELLRPWTVAGITFWYLDPDSRPDVGPWRERVGFDPEELPPELIDAGPEARGRLAALGIREADLLRLDPPAVLVELPVGTHVPRPPPHTLGEFALPDGRRLALLSRSDRCGGHHDAVPDPPAPR